MENKQTIKKLIPLVLLAIVILVGISLLVKGLFKPKDNNNIIYLSNGRLYLLKNDKELGRSELEDVVYNNNDSSIFLYKNENDLYLYNKDSKKVLENARKYVFADNDVLVQDINGALYLYKKGKAEKLDDNIHDLLFGTSKNVYYIKTNKIVKYNFKSKKSEEVTDKSVKSYDIYDENMLYVTSDNIIRKIKMNQEKIDLIADPGFKYYSKKGNDLYYTNSKNELYLNKNGKNKLISSECSSVIDYNEEKEYIIYTKNDGKAYLYYSNKESSLFNQAVLLNRVVVTSKDIYALDVSGIVHKVNNKGEIEDVDNNVYGSLMEYKDHVIYMKYNTEKNYNELYEYKNGKKKLLKEKVKGQSVLVDSTNNLIYYLDDDGNFYSYKNKEKQIDSQVYLYYPLENGKVYYIKDYKTSRAYGDLYLYSKKSKLVKNKVSAITGLNNAIEKE